MDIEEKISALNRFFEEEIVNVEEKMNSVDISNGFWGTTNLVHLTPFDMERNGLQRGRKLTKTPSKKDYKYFHVTNSNNEVFAILAYIANYDLPGQYLFIEKNEEVEYVFSFDILKRLDFVQLSIFKEDKKTSSIALRKNGNYVAEEYSYDLLGRLTAINRRHRDSQKFKNTVFFSDNIFKSSFIIEYDDNIELPKAILWDANPQKRMEKIYPI
jgi:YD repeat-containing protein